MRDDEDREPTMNEADDLLISAWIDDALDPAARAGFAARLAAEPALADRLAEFAAADAEIARLGRAAVAPERLAALRAGVDARLAPTPRRALGGWVAAGLALAAGLTLYLAGVGAPPVTPDAASPRAGVADAGPARAQDIADPLSDAPNDAPGIPTRLAEAGSPVPADGRGTPDPLVASAPEPAHDDVESDPVADQQLAIALEYDLLSDYEVIENLALLEALAAVDAGETM